MAEVQYHGSAGSSSHPHGHHHYHHRHHHHHHIKKHRIPSGTDDPEEEELDPRIQVELERLNKASEEINKLELELDDARAGFRQVLSDSTQCLNGLAKKLGNCVDKARPYYDCRMRLKESHVESQKAALRFERACSMHEAAKEMVQLAEEGYKRREEDLDPTWQEMLNHATMKVNEAEKERMESESNHQTTTINFKKKEEDVQKLQKDLKRSITKSRPYFEMKAKFNQVMEEQKGTVSRLEENVAQAKALYSQALRNLEAISDDIHRTRLEQRQKRELGERGAGVGAEAPSPPPSWDKGINIEGSASSCAFDSDVDDDSVLATYQMTLDGKGIVRHEPPVRNRSSVSEAYIEAASLEPDPLNVVVFKSEAALSSSPQTTVPGFHPPSVINPHPERARSASYRAAMESSMSSQPHCLDYEESETGVAPATIDEEGNGFHDVTPTPESVGKFPLTASSPLAHGVEAGLVSGDSPGFHTVMPDQELSMGNESPEEGVAANLSMAQSSLSRAQEWVNRSPVPQQRRFVKSKSLINPASVSAPSSLLSASSSTNRDQRGGTPEEGEESDHERNLSSSLTTAALRGMRAAQGAGYSSKASPPSYVERAYSSPGAVTDETPTAQPELRLQHQHSVPNPTALQLRASSQGSVRSLGSTPPDDRSSMSSGNSPSSHRKSPKLQGLILKVDPSGGSSGGGSGLVKPAASGVSTSPRSGFASHSGQHSCSDSTLSSSQSQSASQVPRVVISTQHPTLGMFTEQKESVHVELSQPAAVPAAAASRVSESQSPALPRAGPAPRHPTSLITQQLNKMMQAVAAVPSSSSSTSRVSSYSSKTAPSTLMGNSYRLPASSSSKPHPQQISPMRNLPPPLSPTSTDRGLVLTPGGRSDSLSTVGSSSLHSRSVHLKPPSDSSDTESIASTGPMLDDDQVELINMDFSEQSIAHTEDADCDDDYDYPPIDPNLANPRGHWSRMSLPPRLNYLEGFLERAHKLSGDQVPGREETPHDASGGEQVQQVSGGNGDGHSKGVDNAPPVSAKKLESDETVRDEEIVSGVSAQATGDVTNNNSEEDNSSHSVCTSVEATVIISPDEGISVVESSDMAELCPAEDEELLVTKEDHYL